jgi:DNA-binding NarL/FixJ family response regulator
MEKTRVVLCNMPPIMREIIRDLVDRQGDMEVVGDVKTLAGLPQALNACRAEAVVVGLSARDAASTISALQTERPGVLVLSFIDNQHGPIVWSCEGAPQPVEPAGNAVVHALRQCQRAEAGAN